MDLLCISLRLHDGSPEKIALHSFFAGIEGELSGNGFMSGALAGGVNEAAVAKLLRVLGPNNPDLVQMTSAALGYATNKLADEEALAQWGTKWNNAYDNNITVIEFTSINTLCFWIY